MSTRTLSVSLPSDALYVSGTVNDVAVTWTHTEGNTWEAVAGEQSPYRKLISDYQCLVYNHCFDANTYDKMFTVPGT